MRSSSEIDYLNQQVRKHFTVYEFKLFPEYLEFHIIFTGNDEELYKSFNVLWLEIKKHGYIPTLHSVENEYILQIVKTPPRRFRSKYINIILLIATLISTIYVGMQNYAGYFNIFNVWSLKVFIGGLVFFALPLMLILGLHEMGHYFAAKKHHVAASLPFFIPAPTIVGTFGAFISLREPIPDRKALLDIGVAGPIVGFLVAIPIAIIGNWLGSIYPAPVHDVSTYLIFQSPLFYHVINFFYPSSGIVFPTAFAAWVGFLVTAINLFPIGQLDGGHIAKALFGEYSKYLSYIFIIFLFVLGILYVGWMVFAVFVLFLGLRHPPSLNDITRINKKRVVVGIVAFIILISTFVPVPITQVYHHENFEISSSTNTIFLVHDLKNQANVTMFIKNTGQKMINITVVVTNSDNFAINYPKILHDISIGQTISFLISIRLTNNSFTGQQNIFVSAKTMLQKVKRSYLINAQVYNKSNTLVWNMTRVTIPAYTNISVLLTNNGNVTEYIAQFHSSQNYIIRYNATLTDNKIELPPGASIVFTFTFYITGVYHFYAIDQNNNVAVLTVHVI